MTEYAIQTRELTRRFGDVTAVNGLNLAVRPNTIYGLVGPDGAGKTTTLRLLCALLSPDGGTAVIGGVDVHGRPAHIRDHIGYMPQRFSLYGDLTVLENLNFYADIYQIPHESREQKIAQLLAFANLMAHTGKLADQLSGGMKQKLALACNLIHTPRYLLLDEPTIGVDPVARRELWKILFDLRDQGVTILVSTPYMDEAERCDEIGLMDQGTIIVHDRPEAVINSFDRQMVQVYARDNHLVREAARKLPEVDDAYLLGEALHLVTGDGNALIRQLTAGPGAADLGILSAQVTKPSLEDVFVHLVKRRHLVRTRHQEVDHGKSH